MRTLILILIPLFIYSLANAQTGLRGRVIDEKGGALSYVTITILSAKKAAKQTSNTLTDSTGNFTIASPPPGEYYLQFTAIGFAKFMSDSFVVNTPEFEKDFGTVTLKREAKELASVDIRAMRPSIVQLTDRMVINVEGSAMAAGNNAFNVLAKSPGVFVDPEGAIQLNGRGGVTVMIDGRLTFLSARELRNLLESTAAENIKSIEIITNPSAKYDAEGTSGIINIVFKKNVLKGINGSINTNYTTNLKQHFYGAGATINYRSERWNSFFITNFNRRGGGREATFTRIFYAPNKTTYFDQVAEANSYNIGPPTLRVGTDYTLSEKHSVGVIGAFNTNKNRSEFLSNTYIGNTRTAPSQYIDADNYNKNVYKGFSGNVHYVGKLDTLGTTLSADIDVVRMTNRGEGNFYNSFLQVSSGELTTDNLYTYTPNKLNISSGKIDFSYVPNKKHKLEAGGRLSRVESDNDSRFYFNNGNLELDKLRTNHFNYAEKIYAAYLNWAGTLSNKISMQAGLRAEKTISRGQSFTTSQVTERDYLNLFPSVFLLHKVSDNYTVNYSYSRRLTRPNYGSLNPFRAYRDPYTWTEGNPFLRPEYTNLFNITQTFKKIYILQLFYNATSDVMVELPMLDVANTVTVYTTGNVNNAYSGGASAILPVKLAKWWDTRNTAQLSYSKFTTQSAQGALKNEQLFFSLQSAHTLLFKNNFRGEATFLFRSAAASGLYHQRAMYRIDLAASKSFSKKKFEVALNINDVTKGWRFLWTTDIGGNVNEFNQYLRWRTFTLSLRYNFSSGQKVNIRQRSGPEELNRT
jgi:outer membrane receptor protein involved in Fe transport